MIRQTRTRLERLELKHKHNAESGRPVHLIAGQSVADADREIARMIETGEGQDGDFFIALVPPKGFEVSDMPGGQS